MWDEALMCWRVMDFGIAKAEYPGMPQLTSASTALGTPLYMAPELAEDPTGADRRADIYSFGATFYHALTGQPPFEGPSPLSVLIKAKMDPLVSPRSLNPTIPEFLNDCVERCLAKEPADRLQSFHDVLAVLEDAGSSGRSAWDLPNDPISNEAVARYQERRAMYLSEEGPGLREPDACPLPNGRCLTIVHGDITEQDVDAIVSSDDKPPDHGRRSVRSYRDHGRGQYRGGSEALRARTTGQGHRDASWRTSRVLCVPQRDPGVRAEILGHPDSVGSDCRTKPGSDQ
jgi:serine/threonine protein kinase